MTIQITVEYDGTRAFQDDLRQLSNLILEEMIRDGSFFAEPELLGQGDLAVDLQIYATVCIAAGALLQRADPARAEEMIRGTSLDLAGLLRRLR